MTPDTKSWEGSTGDDSIAYNSTASLNGNVTNFAVINTHAGKDGVTLAGNATAATSINLAGGNDILHINSPDNALVAGARYDGGMGGFDTIRHNSTATSTYGFTTKPASTLFRNFENIDLTIGGGQTLNLSLDNVLEMTVGNNVARQLFITSTALQGDKLNLSLNGATLAAAFPVGTNTLAVNDSTGASVNKYVTADNNSDGRTQVGNNGRVYDIYQYNYSGQTVDVMIDQNILTGNRTFIA